MQKILIVDDDIALAKGFATYIGLNGFECEVVHDAQHALSKIREFHPDVVTLDIQLPDETGYFVLEKMRTDTDPVVRNVIVLGVSGRFLEEKDKIDFMNMGGDDFMFKPVMLDALLERIKNLLSKRDKGR